MKKKENNLQISIELSGLIDSWTASFFVAYNKALPDLIDSFVEFYGEENREYITYTIKNLKINFSLSDESYYNITFPGQLNYFARLIRRYLKTVNSELNIRKSKGEDEQKLSDIYTKICSLGASSEKLLDKYYEMYENEFDAMAYGDTVNGEEIKGIIIPILALNNLGLIHEINHVIGIHLAASLNNQPVFFNILKYTETKEMLNHLCAIEINKIFERKGTSLLPPLNIDYELDYKVPLFKKFFTTFKRLLKKGIISGDENLINVSLGEEYLAKFESLTTRLFYEENISKNDKERIDFLIAIMKKNYKNRPKNNLLNDIAALESMGYRVRRLK